MPSVQEVQDPQVAARSDGQTLSRWLVQGPDPIEKAEPAGVLEVLLPWPIRCAVVAATFAASWWWRDTGYGQQVAWGLQYGAAALVAIVASFWWQTLLVDLALAGLWFIEIKPRAEAPVRWAFLHIVTFLNRQAGHLEALFVWMVLALGCSALFPLQTTLLAAVYLLGLPFLNWLARREWWWERFRVDSTTKSNGDLLWRRRIFIYLATLLGLSFLALWAWGQIWRLLPLVGAFVPGIVLRIVRYTLRADKISTAKKANDQAKLAARAMFREQQAQTARRVDGGGVALVIGVLIAIVAFSWWQRRKLDEEQSAQLGGASPPTDGCTRDPRGPTSANVALFLLADAQTHELGGKRSPGQTELANVFAGTASRPVPLDVLSAVPVWQLAAMHQALAAQRPDGKLPWAHLGDLADLACTNELERFATQLESFAPTSPMAGISPGNHEMSFMGSFHWSPYWDAACRSGRLDKNDAMQMIEAHFGARVRAAGGDIVRFDSSFLNPRGGALFGVSPLGIVAQGKRSRGIVGVFLDTNDGRAFDLGLPGTVGSVSEAQLEAVAERIAILRGKSGSAYHDDPAYVILTHIPYTQLQGSSSKRVEAFVDRLDDKSVQGAGEGRVLALIAAHTHKASTRTLCVAKRTMREIVIGSTIDPPEQGALVEVGVNAEGRLALSLRTLQTVARPGATCASSAAVPASECRRVAATLVAAPACRRVLGLSPDGQAPRDCQDLERPFSLPERWAALRTFRGPLDLDEKWTREEGEAKQLLDCVCRNGDCAPSEAPFAQDQFAKVINQALLRPDRQRELVCLAWAASACQAHKMVNMTMGEALRCSFDDPSAPAEMVSVATEEVTSCY